MPSFSRLASMCPDTSLDTSSRSLKTRLQDLLQARLQGSLHTLLEERLNRLEARSKTHLEERTPLPVFARVCWVFERHASTFDPIFKPVFKSRFKPVFKNVSWAAENTRFRRV